MWDNNVERLEMGQLAEAQKTFVTKVYGWMGFALLVTALVSIFTLTSVTMMELAYNRMVFFGAIIAEFGLVVFLSARIRKMTPDMAIGAFLGYAALTGFTLSLVLSQYVPETVYKAFFTTAGMFGFMCFYGYTTKKDLTSWGSFFMMGLVGMIIASVVNIFLGSSTIYWLTTYLGVLIFVGLTAYDAQKIKQMYVLGSTGTREDEKIAIYGALTLYLDFINLFILLLRIFGKGDD